MKRLRHIVLLKFKDNCTQTQIKIVENAFITLKSQIETIQDFEWGLNNSPEHLNEGYTHCFMITFNNEADRQIYLPHQAHRNFIEILKQYMESGIVIDYWTE